MYLLDSVTCFGDVSINTFFPEVVSLIVKVIKIGVPIVLIILGMMDMFKAMTAQKEDEIKKAQGIFIKRLVAGVLVFLVFVIVELLFSVLSGFEATGADSSVWDCANCFIIGVDGGKCGSLSVTATP